MSSTFHPVPDRSLQDIRHEKKLPLRTLLSDKEGIILARRSTSSTWGERLAKKAAKLTGKSDKMKSKEKSRKSEDIAGRMKYNDPNEDAFGTSTAHDNDDEVSLSSLQESLGIKNRVHGYDDVDSQKKILSRLIKDLQKIKRIDLLYDRWVDAVRSRRFDLWDPINDDGVIPWRIHPTPSDLAQLKLQLDTGAERRRMEEYYTFRGFVREIDNHEEERLPRLSQPEYRFFSDAYNSHLDRAIALRTEREELIETYGEDGEAYATDQTACLEKEAMKAWDILRILQLTYKGLMIEYERLLEQQN